MIVQHGEIEHGLGIAKVKGHHLVLFAGEFGHQQISMVPVGLALPSSGSFKRMCMVAQAMSAWLVSLPLPALNVTDRPEAVSVFLIEMKLPIRSTQDASKATRPREITFCAFMIIVALTSRLYSIRVARGIHLLTS